MEYKFTVQRVEARAGRPYLAIVEVNGRTICSLPPNVGQEDAEVIARQLETLMTVAEERGAGAERERIMYGFRMMLSPLISELKRGADVLDDRLDVIGRRV